MTYEDFGLISGVIAGLDLPWVDDQYDDKEDIALAFADALAEIWPHFDREAFLDACKAE